ncbi:MAG: family 20 glycosylhydrolase [Candidatus Aminicenantes bacterium]|nr:family 20 glycosylhydrolase [Candidatus Aminicenantes bacterium]
MSQRTNRDNRRFNRPRWRAATVAFIGTAALVCQAGCRPSKPAAVAPLPARPLVLGLHVLIESKGAAEELIKEIPALAGAGVNLLVVESDYNYEYESHPELRGEDPISKATVKRIVALAREYKIRLVPEFQALGHQSWAGKTFPLLTRYPEFDETPGKFPGNEGIYCRSWCPLHPGVNPIVFDLLDELIDGYEADGLHVGMDEVFLIASDYCPRCKGKDPADLFAKAVNDLYGHIVTARGKEMWMWGDRLIEGPAMSYGVWESSYSGTWRAVDRIPKDIVICDWHYEPMKAYPSVKVFLDKGFRVLPTSFRNVPAAEALLDYSLGFDTNRMLGHLCTIWRGPKAGETSNFPALRAIARRLGRKPA